MLDRLGKRRGPAAAQLRKLDTRGGELDRKATYRPIVVVTAGITPLSTGPAGSRDRQCSSSALTGKLLKNLTRCDSVLAAVLAGGAGIVGCWSGGAQAVGAVRRGSQFPLQAARSRGLLLDMCQPQLGTASFCRDDRKPCMDWDRERTQRDARMSSFRFTSCVKLGRSASGCEHSLLSRINEYYDRSHIDYRLVWTSRQELAYHFGYFDHRVCSHRQSLVRINEVMADQIGLAWGARVLDAGCGIGGSSVWLARERRAEVVGIALGDRQLARAREYARMHGLSARVSFAVADYARTPFPAASFDVVWAQESLCHAPDKGSFYSEAGRVLRPGGGLIVAEFLRSGRQFSARTERIVRAWLDGWAIPDLDTYAEHRAAIERAGFEPATVRDITVNILPSLRRLFRLAWLGLPVDLVLQCLGLRDSTQHGNVVAAYRQFQALRRGAWFYALLCARKPAC
jgi:tocopherol O-methyltransferase